MSEEIEIDQLIKENKCWSCKVELCDDYDNRISYIYICPECKDIYYSCKQCEKETNDNPVSIDCEDNHKGTFCDKCNAHFCSLHWQNMKGKYHSINTNHCNECHADERKKVKIQKKIKK